MTTSLKKDRAKNDTPHEIDLPEGWTIARLEQTCTSPQYGWTTSADKSRNDLKLLRTTDISKGVIDWSAVPGCERQPDNPEKYLIALGDIVVSRAGSVGLSYVVKECPRSIFASYLIRFRAIPPMDSEFVGLYLKTPQYWAAIADETAGIAIPNVNASKLKRLKIPLPPLAEQKRIVAKVEQLLERINAARERLAKVPGILKRFRQAVLAAACSGCLTAGWRARNFGVDSASEKLRTILAERRAKWEAAELTKMKSRGSLPRDDKWKKKYRGPLDPSINNLPELDETWTWATIDQIRAHEPNAITDGPFGSNLKTAHYTESGPRVIRLQNIGDGIFIDEHTHISDEHFEKLGKHGIFSGDVIIATLGNPIPRACVLPDHVGPAIVKADCIRLKPHHDLAVRRYVAYTLNDYSTRMRMAEVVHGVGRARLNLREVKAIPVPLPPLVEQREIVRRVEALFKLASTIEKRVVAAAVRAERLTKAILAKAFRGELVPQDPNDEPASVLLERIQSVRFSDSSDIKAFHLRSSRRKV